VNRTPIAVALAVGALIIAATALFFITRPAASRPVTVQTLIQRAHHAGTFSYGAHTPTRPNFFSLAVIPAPEQISGSREVEIWTRGAMKSGWVARSSGELMQYPKLAGNHICMLTGSTRQVVNRRVMNRIPRGVAVQFNAIWPSSGRAMWELMGGCLAMDQLIK
jgi:hypothetical protein